MESSERRIMPRYNVRIPIRFHSVGLATTGMEHYTESLNISRRGLFFASREELRVGMPIEISMRMPREVTGLETVDTRCFGRVVHARAGMFADGSTGYGVEIEKFTSPAYAEKWAS
jgi:hypothetical protein